MFFSLCTTSDHVYPLHRVIPVTMVWLYRPCAFHCARPVTMYILFTVWYQWPQLFLFTLHGLSDHILSIMWQQRPWIRQFTRTWWNNTFSWLSLSRKCHHLWRGRVVCTDSAWQTCVSCWPRCPPALPLSSGLVSPASARQTSGFPTTGWVSTYGYTGVEIVSNIVYVFSRFSVCVRVRACVHVCVCMHATAVPQA